MFADQNYWKLGIKVFFLIVVASSLLHTQASAQQLTSCTSGNPSTPCIQKFLDPLPYPPFFQSTPQLNGAVDAYEIAARQFKEPMLSSNTGLLTTVWGYGYTGFPYNYTAPTTVCHNDGTDTAPCFSSPALTIFTRGTAVHVKWINDLVCHTGDANCTVGTAFTYTAGVKPSFTNHWANPSGTCNNHTTGTDCQGVGGYTGPPPLVVHAHGEVSASESDGIPEAWTLTKNGSFSANLFPFAHGSDFCQANPATFGTTVLPGRDTNCRTRTSADSSYKGDGAALFTYPNRQFATTLFFHDHALGVTTENVYMGLAGFYLIGGVNQSPSVWCNGNCSANPFNFSDDLPPDCSLSPDGNCHLYGTNLMFPSTTGGLPQGDCSGTGIQAGNCFLVPLAIGDRAFNLDGSLRFSENGNVIVANGKSWPYFNVQPRKYRFRLVVAAPTSRFDLMFPGANNNDTGLGGPTVTMTQIGADAGLLPHPSNPLTKLSLMPGERADVIVDFSSFWLCNYPNPPAPTVSGCMVQLLNGNGSGDRGQVMQFNVVAFPNCPSLFDQNGNFAACAFPTTADSSCNLTDGTGKVILSCTASDTLPHRSSETATATRQVSLFDDHLGSCGPLNANTKCVSSTPLPWDGNVTENPQSGSTEIWEMYDFQDSHPMHLHEAAFEVINRENMSTHVVYNCIGSAKNANGQTVPCNSAPVPGETGFKDTVQVNASTITRLRVTFKGPVGPTGNAAPEVHPGLFAWHCHINPHEDNEMMRPMCVQPSSALPPSDGAEYFCQ